MRRRWSPPPLSCPSDDLSSRSEGDGEEVDGADRNPEPEDEEFEQVEDELDNFRKRVRLSLDFSSVASTASGASMLLLPL